MIQTGAEIQVFFHRQVFIQQAFLKNKAIVDVSDEEIDTVAGGKSGEDMVLDVLFSTTVIGCVIGPVMSEVYKSEGMDTRCILED